MQQTMPKYGNGRARFEQGSMRRDEYGRPEMGGDIVIKEGRGVTDARSPRAYLKEARKIGMQDMHTAPPLQHFFRNAQSKLALSGDKYAQRVIIQDDKSQLTIAEFTSDETRHACTPSRRSSTSKSTRSSVRST
jgi:hypothetical protein